MQTTTPQFQMHHRLALAMDDRGVSREHLAEFLHTHPNTVSNYRSGKTQPQWQVLVAIAEYLGVDLVWLLTGKVRPKGRQGQRSDRPLDRRRGDGHISQYVNNARQYHRTYYRAVA